MVELVLLGGGEGAPVDIKVEAVQRLCGIAIVDPAEFGDDHVLSRPHALDEKGPSVSRGERAVAAER